MSTSLPGSGPLSRAAVRFPLLKWFRILDGVDGGEVACQNALLGLIQWFDTAASPAEPTAAALQALTRAIAAAGRALAAHEGFDLTHPVYRTIALADEYARRPSQQTYQGYFGAATRSFPYGAGEGCYRVKQLSAECGPGSGCRSGAGSLYCVARVVGAQGVVAAVRREVEPWARRTEVRSFHLGE